MNNKKGISPLIATVLIVGIVIALSFLVTTWITGTVEDTIDDTDCTVEAENMCLELTGAVELSIDGIEVVVSNEGSIATGGITVVRYDGAGSTGTEDITSINAYNTSSTTGLRIEQGDTFVKVFMTGTDADGMCSVDCTPLVLEL